MFYHIVSFVNSKRTPFSQIGVFFIYLLLMSKVFTKNVGQQRVLDLILNENVRELLVASGSRSGKTFIILYAMIFIASKFAGSRHLVARKHFSHVKGSIWLDTLPKVIDICFPNLKPHVKWNNTDYYITLPNGSTIFLVGLDDKERVDKILGREYLTMLFNECSELNYDTYTTVKSRLAQQCTFVNAKGVLVTAKNMIFADCNPTSSRHFTKVLFVDKIDPETRAKVSNPERYAYTFIHPSENAENISADYLEMLANLPPAKRRRFLDGQFSEASAYALWTDEMLSNTRVNEAPVLRRIVIAVDPAVSATDESDETGIIVAGIGVNQHLYILEDATDTYTMTGWANKVADLYNKWNADRVVGEINQGGDLVEVNLRTVAPNIPYTAVRATKSKFSRAEPVAALYEQNKAHHVGIFVELEDQQTSWEGKKGEKSPNNIDALVWAASDLFPELGVNKKVTGSFVQAMRGL